MTDVFQAINEDATVSKFGPPTAPPPVANSQDAALDPHELRRQFDSTYPRTVVSIGDHVRWWPWVSELGTPAERAKYIDGVVTKLVPLCLRVTGSCGFTARCQGGWSMPAVGGEVDTSVRPGLIRRIVEKTPVDPLDVGYDGVKLRNLLEMRERVNREQDMPSSATTIGYEWRAAAPLTWTPAQRAAVSAHWSAQLRAKVAEGAAKERNKVTYCEVDSDD